MLPKFPGCLGQGGYQGLKCTISSQNLQFRSLSYLHPNSNLRSIGCVNPFLLFSLADSPSLLACSLVCVDWQRLLLGCVYTTAKFRRRVRNALFGGLGTPSKLVFTLEVKIGCVDFPKVTQYSMLNGIFLGGGKQCFSDYTTLNN